MQFTCVPSYTLELFTFVRRSAQVRSSSSGSPFVPKVNTNIRTRAFGEGAHTLIIMFLCTYVFVRMCVRVCGSVSGDKPKGTVAPLERLENDR